MQKCVCIELLTFWIVIYKQKIDIQASLKFIIMHYVVLVIPIYLLKHTKGCFYRLINCL